MNHCQWADVFASLSDEAFFAIARNYLGPVKTPFHKPDIAGRLEKFFDRPEIQERIRDLLDAEDTRILSVVALAEHASKDFLQCIFHDTGLLALYKQLYNLQERLLLYESPESSYRLTPLAQSLHVSGYIGVGVLLGESTGVPKADIHSWYNDNFFTFALNFLLEDHLMFKKEGAWRKKTLEILQERFKGFFQDVEGKKRLMVAGRGFLAAGLINRSERGFKPDIEAWRELEKMPPEERRIIMLIRSAGGRSLPEKPLVRIARFFTECLIPGKSYPTEKLIRIIQIASNPPVSDSCARSILSNLLILGELGMGPEESMGRPIREKTENNRLITLSETGDISLYPGMPLMCDLALATQALKFDIVCEYRIDREHFTKALNEGLKTRDFLARLEQNLGHPLSNTVNTLIAEWEKTYRSISMHMAIVLQAEDPYRNIIEESGVLNAYKKPAPGIWLLNPLYQQEWSKALAELGIERFATMDNNLVSETSLKSVPKRDFPLLRLGQNISGFIDDEIRQAPALMDYQPILKFIASDKRVEALSAQEREIFFSRLQRRIILHPEQIQPKAWRYETMSAKGFDYQGKLRLAEAALCERNEWLDITLGDKDSIKTLTIAPKSIEKKEDGHYLQGFLFPDGKAVSCSMRKISLLKRIKLALF